MYKKFRSFEQTLQHHNLITVRKFVIPGVALLEPAVSQQAHVPVDLITNQAAVGDWVCVQILRPAACQGLPVHPGPHHARAARYCR